MSADLPLVYANRWWGATTVAATMILAQQAGIEVFVTGGIGGVHRHVEDTLDISADLEELARTDVTVVCAGAKAILDLPRTLQYLETKGVPVYGFQTSAFQPFMFQTAA
jgi:pseudouridine-5'-phosphate glycosidase